MERVKDIQETMLLWDDTSNRLVGITPDAEVRQGNRATSGLSSFELMGRSTWGGTTYFNVKYLKYFLRPVLHMATNAIWSTGRVKYFNYFVVKYLMPPQVAHRPATLPSSSLIRENFNLWTPVDSQFVPTHTAQQPPFVLPHSRELQPLDLRRLPVRSYAHHSATSLRRSSFERTSTSGPPVASQFLHCNLILIMGFCIVAAGREQGND
jgi:hypothetical protein